MGKRLRQFEEYLESESRSPLFFVGDAHQILEEIPNKAIDFCMTSPPYWGKREYSDGGIGLEEDYHEYIDEMVRISRKINYVLKDQGSFWLNIGDKYQNKSLIGIPWRVALRLIDEQGWTLRNSVIWNKIKGPDNAKDKLRNVHEHLFHFVKNPKGFYYDTDSIRSKPRKAQVKNGAVVSATGVTGVRYRRQIELSTSLTDEEKTNALQALEKTLREIKEGKLSDFRMVIRDQQRITHSNSGKLSGRAKELQEKGFYILRYHPKGSKPGDVWDIIPEDQSVGIDHYSIYPEDLCKTPILATCPPEGIVLDPFCGTGTTNFVAQQLERKSVGIDISQKYIKYAEERCHTLI